MEGDRWERGSGGGPAWQWEGAGDGRGRWPKPKGFRIPGLGGGDPLLKCAQAVAF